jgi:hypothetical protein
LTKRSFSHLTAYIVVSVALMVTGCKENTIINTNITPAGDSIFTDVQIIPINAKTVESHFVTSSYLSGLSVIQGIGIISDPQVGTTDASMYMQLIPKQSTGYSLPANIDSFVLVLPYANFTYGDSSITAANQTFSVHRLTQDLTRSADTAYYDNDYKTFDPAVLGSATVNYNSLKDSLTIEGKTAKAAPHLRITLDKATMQSILGNANYNSYADFLEFFKGVYIRSNTTGNTISYFRLTDDGKGNTYSKAGIVAYYKIGDSVVGDQFGFNPDNCAHFNRIVNNYTADTSNFLFLQSRPGLSIEISTKGLAALPNRLVNRAEIVITEAANDPKHFPSEWVYPYTVGGKGSLNNDSLLLIADATFKSNTGTSVSGLGFIDGKVRKVTINGTVYNQYVVNCPKEFQKALKEGREMTMRITGVTNGYIGAYRMKAYKSDQTGLNTPLNIHLNVVYSGIK